MALRAARLVSTTYLPRSCQAKRCHSSIYRVIYDERGGALPASLVPAKFPPRCPRPDPDRCDRFRVKLRSFSSGGSEHNSKESTDEESYHSHDGQPLLLYEAPFASLTLKLKRISLTSAVIAIIGLPGLSIFYGAGSVPATGQLAIIATAGATAIGSTVLLGYCFSPYVHTLERLFEVENDADGDVATNAVNGNTQLVRIISRDILSRRVETIFDPTTDVSPPPNNNSRPFCNFMVKGLPMYVHPELIHDYKLRVQLVGEDPQQEDAEERNKKKFDDDEFL